MTTDLTEDMIHIMTHGLLKLAEETPATDAKLGVLQKCEETVEWLQSQAQQINADTEVTGLLVVAIAVVSQKIDQAKKDAQAKLAIRRRESGKVEPFDLVRLIAAWDRDYPGGSAAVFALFREIGSKVRERMQNQDESSDK